MGRNNADFDEGAKHLHNGISNWATFGEIPAIDEGQGKEQWDAVNRALASSGKNSVPLYRGASLHPLEEAKIPRSDGFSGKPGISFTTSLNVAKHHAKLSGGKVYMVPAGSVRGLDVNSIGVTMHDQFPADHSWEQEFLVHPPSISRVEEVNR